MLRLGKHVANFKLSQCAQRPAIGGCVGSHASLKLPSVTKIHRHEKIASYIVTGGNKNITGMFYVMPL